MRTLTASAFVAAGAVLWGGGASAALTVSQPAASEIRVMTFNIQHGIDEAGQYGLHWAIDTIAALHPDIVGVQELTRNHPSYKCEDQPKLIAQGLSAKTGRSWSYVYKQEWTTKIVDCHGDTPETEGIGFFAPAPITEAGSLALWNGRVGLKTILPTAHGLPIIVTHLQNGKLAQNASDRVRQASTLVPWTARQGTPRIVVCDCNMFQGSPEYQQFRAVYHDAWADALAAGTARGRMDGITHKSSRIDYVFFDPGNSLELESVEDVDTKALIGTESSDHRPVVAVFKVR